MARMLVGWVSGHLPRDGAAPRGRALARGHAPARRQPRPSAGFRPVARSCRPGQRQRAAAPHAGLGALPPSRPAVPPRP
eukprot:3778230-Prymnesium_polylepis.1